MHTRINEHFPQCDCTVRDQLLHYQVKLYSPTFALQAHSSGRVGGKVVGFQPLFLITTVLADQPSPHFPPAAGTCHTAFMREKQPKVSQYFCLGTDQGPGVALPDYGLLDCYSWTNTADLIELVFLSDARDHPD